MVLVYMWCQILTQNVKACTWCKTLMVQLFLWCLWCKNAIFVIRVESGDDIYLFQFHSLICFVLLFCAGLCHRQVDPILLDGIVPGKRIMAA